MCLSYPYSSGLLRWYWSNHATEVIWIMNMDESTHHWNTKCPFDYELCDTSCFNSLQCSDAIWHQICWSTLVQVMAWCLMAPSHYLNQCWLISMWSSGIHSKITFAWILKISIPSFMLPPMTTMSASFFLLFHVYINASQYDNTFCLPYFHVSNSALFSAQYFSTLILRRHSLDNFYMQGANIQCHKVFTFCQS